MIGIPCFVNYNTMIVNVLFKYNFNLNDTCTILIIVKYIERGSLSKNEPCWS